MQAKSTLRAQVARRRAHLSESARHAAGAALATALEPLLSTAAQVAAYAAVGTEPETAAIMAFCHGWQIPLLLPLLQPDGDLDWAQHAPDEPLLPGRYGLLEPAGRALGRDAIASCEVVLVPALLVDRRGHRLGRGGGSYDRALPRTAGRSLALLYDGELVDRLPYARHDAPVGGVVLPAFGVVDDLAEPAARQ